MEFQDYFREKNINLWQEPGVEEVAFVMRRSGEIWDSLRTDFNMDYFRSANISNMADSMKKFGAQTATFFSRAKQVRFFTS